MTGIEQGEVQTDAQEMASLMAGYNQTRGEQPPVEEESEPSTEQEINSVIEEPIEPEPTVANLADELKALKAKVAASTGDHDDVRRMHGEIGNINRTLQQRQVTEKSEVAPVDDEWTAAIKEAEAAADEFPELVGPLVKALKMSMARNQGHAQPEDIDERVSTAVSSEVSKIRQKDAIEALTEEHPDYATVRETPEYKTWLSGKTPEFQTRFNSTWNPAVVARGLTEFKDSIKTKQKKQDRLASAVTPQGVPHKAGSSTLPDEEGLWAGYNSGPKRRILNR